MTNVVLHPAVATSVTPPKVRSHRIFAMLALWRTLWSERRALAKLDDRMLRDIGIDAEMARCELARAPWDLPFNRMAE